MKRFAELLEALQATSKTSVKRQLLSEYFGEASDADAAWALFFLSGRRLKRVCPASDLRQAVREASGFDDWIIDACVEVTGDRAEAYANILRAPGGADTPPLHAVLADVQALANVVSEVRIARIRHALQILAPALRWAYLKSLTGAFRVGVSSGLVMKSLAALHDRSEVTVAERLAGSFVPTADAYRALFDAAGERSRQPYPFYLATPLDAQTPPESLGSPDGWLAEWKWDGIRLQLIRRGDVALLWSRGGEVVNDAFPELMALAEALPQDAVIDGEALAYRDGAPLPFAELGRRLGRKAPSRKLQQAVPVVLMAYDLLELAGEDLRSRPLSERRAMLAQLEAPGLVLSPSMPFDSWDALAAARAGARERGVEGIMLKSLAGAYRHGRPRGEWWKWKVDPHTVDAVLMYAQSGSGRRAGQLTDYTFGVWDDDTLVPIAKAYSGLTQDEIVELDRWLRANTQERFGPVRAVRPEQVFELAFDSAQASTRHKSGVALRFPRMHRWRTDKRPEDANTLAELKSMVALA